MLKYLLLQQVLCLNEYDKSEHFCPAGSSMENSIDRFNLDSDVPSLQYNCASCCNATVIDLIYNQNHPDGIWNTNCTGVGISQGKPLSLFPPRLELRFKVGSASYRLRNRILMFVAAPYYK